MHGGSAPQVKAAAARRVALGEVEREAVRLGWSLDVDPLDALTEVVREAAANVAAFRSAVEQLGLRVAEDGGVAVPDGRDGRAEARPHVLVVMYAEWLDRLARFAKLALDAGVDERRVRLAEMEGRVLAAVVEAAVDACHPTLEERSAALQAAAGVMRRHAGTGDAA